MSEKHKSRNELIGIGFIIGIIIGTVVGAITDNIGFWIAMGTTFSLVFGAGLSAQLKKKVDD